MKIFVFLGWDRQGKIAYDDNSCKVTNFAPLILLMFMFYLFYSKTNRRRVSYRYYSCLLLL